MCMPLDHMPMSLELDSNKSSLTRIAHNSYNYGEDEGCKLVCRALTCRTKAALRCYHVADVAIGNQLAVHPAGHVALGLCNVAGMAAVPCRYTKSEFAMWCVAWVQACSCPP